MIGPARHYLMRRGSPEHVTACLLFFELVSAGVRGDRIPDPRSGGVNALGGSGGNDRGVPLRHGAHGNSRQLLVGRDMEHRHGIGARVGDVAPGAGGGEGHPVGCLGHVVLSRFKSGSETTETVSSRRLVTQSDLPSGAIPLPRENVLGMSGWAPGGPSGSKTLLTTARDARSTTMNPCRSESWT